MRVGVVSTLLPGLKPSTVAKTLRILRERLAHSGATVGGDREVPHETQALAQAIDAVEPDSDLVIVFGASAITDRRDVIPAAIESAGGAIEQFGMPVDPGNLLLLGRTRSGKTVLGAPGCARSPKENGFDWVLDRLLADVPVTPQDIRRMGAGGLLMEIVSRPQPRGGEAPRPEADNGDE
jgi:molybdenum cofactor cytidylyltransferase